MDVTAITAVQKYQLPTSEIAMDCCCFLGLAPRARAAPSKRLRPRRGLILRV